MRALGFPVKKADVKQLMSSYDIDGSGKIEFTDFVDISEWLQGQMQPLAPSSLGYAVCLQ
jgi:Ca2+-binding EF-hand superfamily protein